MIHLTSLQRDENGRDEKIVLDTPGIYGEKDGVRYVSYEETQLAGLEGTTTTLRVYEDHVTLSREGSFLQEQHYAVGKQSISNYETPMGALEVMVTTREIEDTLKDGNGRIRLSYDVELKGFFQHLNEIVVDVQEDEDRSWK